jgi:hypothetical protein
LFLFLSYSIARYSLLKSESFYTLYNTLSSTSRLPPIIPLAPYNPACPLGFSAPHGLTTAERRNKYFTLSYNKSHECLWDGPTWPYATAITLTAVAKVLSDPRLKSVLQPAPKSASKSTHNPTIKKMPEKHYISKEDYFSMLMTYAKSHRRTKERGEKGWIEVEKGENEKEKNTICWLDENLDPMTGADSGIYVYFTCLVFIVFSSTSFEFSIFYFFTTSTLVRFTLLFVFLFFIIILN